MSLVELTDRHHANNAGFCRHYMTLYSVVLGMETKSAFEFGSGFSTKAILMALELTGGKLITCDKRAYIDTAIFYDPKEMNYQNWEYIRSDSSCVGDYIKNDVFDFVLHDGSHKKSHVMEDLRMIIPKMMKDSILLMHDTEHKECDLSGILTDLCWFKHSKVTLPYGYGLTIIRVEEDFGNGKVDIKWQKTK